MRKVFSSESVIEERGKESKNECSLNFKCDLVQNRFKARTGGLGDDDDEEVEKEEEEE